mgnify:CR=1 FL=1
MREAQPKLINGYIIDTTRVVGVIRLEKEAVELHTIYKILKCLYDNGELNVSEMVKKCGVSYTTASKYSTILREYGFVEVEVKGREKKLKLTEKGMEYLLLFTRLLSLFKKA